MCTCRALSQLPLITEQVVKIIITPRRWRYRPCSFQAAGDCVISIALAERVFPAEALLFNACTCWFPSNVLHRVCGTVSFAEGMPACNKRNSFIIVHSHATEG